MNSVGTEGIFESGEERVERRECVASRFRLGRSAWGFQKFEKDYPSFDL